MSWFKSCAVALLLLFLFNITVIAQTVDCNDPNASTPNISNHTSTNPTFCYSGNGSIRITDISVEGGGPQRKGEWQFRFNNGAWTSNTTFNNLLPGNFNLYARNTVTGCVTEYDGNPIELSGSGGQPIINTINVTESSFCTNNGIIEVANVSNPAPGGYFDLRYRLNGGAWSSSSTFSNLAGGNYTVEVATSDQRCISSETVTVPKFTGPSISSVTTSASNSCSTPNGQIQINATSAYDLIYSIDNGVNWWGDPLFTNLSPGTYQVAVAIAGDERCKITRTATVGGTTTINISSVTTTAATACSAADGKITINATGTGLYYKVAGGQWQTSKTITGLTPGTYNVFVKNSNGTCEVAYTSNPVQVGGAGSIVISSVNTVNPTNCDTLTANGQITINATGGTGLRYSINGGATFTTTNVFSNLRAGTYNVVVAKSDLSCRVNYQPVVLSTPSGITISTVATTRPTLCGVSNGALTITATPTGTYQYSINGGQTFQTSATFSNLAQGNYSIVVKSTTTGCVAYHNTNPLVLTPQSCPEICNDGIDNDGVGGIDNCPDAICGLTPIQVQVTQTNCSSNAKGAISVNTTHAVRDVNTLKPGDIVITNINAGSIFSDEFTFVSRVNLAGGTQLIFTDKGWKSAGGFVTSEGLAQWTAPTGGVTAGTAITIIRSFSSATATVGTVKFDESISGYTAFDSSNPDFELSSSGDQLIVLTGNGAAFAAGDVNQLRFVTAIHTNGTSWDTDATSTSSSAIPPSLINGTTATAVGDVSSATLPAPDISISYSIDGGRTFQTSNSFSNLNLGFYAVLVKKGTCITAYSGNPVEIYGCTEICGDGIDNNGNGQADCADAACSVSSISVLTTLPGCPPLDTLGKITINLSGTGGSSFQYSINNGSSWQASSSFNNLGTGNYQIKIKRNNTGCETSYTNNPVVMTSSVCREIAGDGIDNDKDGAIDCDDRDLGINPGDYEIKTVQPTCPFNSNNGSITIQNKQRIPTKDFFTLQPGDIAITAYDADPDQFTFTTRVNIAAGTKIIFTDKGWETTPPDFKGTEGLAQWMAPTGGVAAGTAITIVRAASSATVGTVLFDEAIPNYQVYDNNNPDFNFTNSGDQLIALCATSFDTAQLSQITFLAAINANATTWDADATSDATSALPPGLTNGVTAIALGKVAEVNNISFPPTPAPYAYSINNGISFQTDSLFSNLAPGTYQVSVKNQTTGCIVPLGNPVVLQAPNCPEICNNTIDDDGDGDTDCADSDCGVPAFAAAFTRPNCPPNDTTGSITITPFGAASNYQYSKDNGVTWQNTPIFSNVAEGDYTIVVKRISSGCTLAYSGNPIQLRRVLCQEICNDGIDNDFDNLIDCADPDCNVPKIEGTNTTAPSFCYNSDGSITVLAVNNGGGTGDPSEWEYSKDNGATWQNSNVFTGLATGTYVLKVRNKITGCQLPNGSAGASASVTLTPANTTSGISVFVQPLASSFCNDNDGQLIVTATNGTPPYQYRLNGGAWNTNNTFANLSSGNYTVEVAANGGKCISSTIISLPKRADINITNVSANRNCTDNSGTIQITASTTDSLALEYSINDGNTWSDSPNFTNLAAMRYLAAGSYQIVVRYKTDTRCVKRYATPVAIEAFVPINITSVVATPTTKCDTDDGRITILATSNGTLEYKIAGTDWQSSNQFTALAPGIYSAYVRYAAYPDSACVIAYSGNPVTVVKTIPAEICGDGIDNNCDGLADCEDNACKVPAFEVLAVQPRYVPTQVKGSITIAPLDSNRTYQYSIDGGASRVATRTFTQLEVGNYNVYVYSNGCEQAYNLNPVALVNPTEVCDNEVDDDGDGLVDCNDPECNDADCNSATERTICYGEEITIGMETDDCVKWEPANGIENPHPNFIKVRPDKTTTYKMHISDDDGNAETKTFTVNVLPKLPVTITATENIICEGVTSTLTATSGYKTYLWSTTEISQTINVQIAGIYSVTVTNDNGCTGTASIEIKEASEVEVQIQPNPAIICSGQQIELTAPYKPGNNYQWSTNDGSFTASQNIEKIIANTDGTYTVTVTYANGCQSTGSTKVESKENPNAIKQVLENDGFVCIPITITATPPGLNSKDSKFEKNTEVVDNQAPGVAFSFQAADNENVTTDYLKSLLEASLTGQNACGTTPKGLITTDNSFCNSDFYQQKKGDFSGNDVGIWMHLFNAEGNNDCLYVKGFGTEGQGGNLNTEYFTYILDKLGQDPDNYGLASSSEKLLSFIINEATTSYIDTIPVEQLTPSANGVTLTPIYPTGDLSLVPEQLPCQSNTPVVGISPSGSPVWLPTGISIRFGIKDKYIGLIDNRATTGFTIHEGAKKGTYRAYACKGQFTGYKTTTGQRYTFDTSKIPASETPAWLGEFVDEACPKKKYIINSVRYRYTSKTEDAVGSGTFIPDFENNVITKLKDENEVIYLCEGEITNEGYNQPLRIDLLRLPSGQVTGWVVYVRNANGGTSVVYVKPVKVNNEDSFEYYSVLCDGRLGDRIGWIEEWSLLSKALYNFRDGLIASGHTILDLVGIVFEPADYVNALWYSLEGKPGEAALTLATSLPVVDIAYKIGKLTVKIGGKVVEVFGLVIRYTDESGAIVAVARSTKEIAAGAEQLGMTDEQITRYIGWLDKFTATTQSNAKFALNIIDDIDITKIWKYADEAGLDNTKLTQLFDDLAGNATLLDKFKLNPGLIKAWEGLFDWEIFRKNPADLETLFNYFTRTRKTPEQFADELFTEQSLIRNWLDDQASNIYRFTSKQIDDYVAFAAKQGDKSKVMLGMWDGGGSTSYISKAGSDYTYFDMGSKWDEAKALVQGGINEWTDEMWEINKQFLITQRAAGKEFWFSHNPFSPLNEQFFAREINWLIDEGVQDFIQVGDLWKAVW